MGYRRNNAVLGCWFFVGRASARQQLNRHLA